MGIVSIIAGGYILMYPVLVGQALPQFFVLILGLWGIIKGLILLFFAFKGGGWGVALVWIGAVFAFIGGFFMVYQAFKMRKA
jgi:uncharacterized membrane protein HdeD (DUF308 family)